MGVEKVSAGSDLVGLGELLSFSLLLFLGGESLRCGRLAEEAYQSLKVLRRRGQEELLPYELQSPQTQAAHSDLILQFGKQRFHFLPLPLRVGELRRVR